MNFGYDAQPAPPPDVPREPAPERDYASPEAGPAPVERDYDSPDVRPAPIERDLDRDRSATEQWSAPTPEPSYHDEPREASAAPEPSYRDEPREPAPPAEPSYRDEPREANQRRSRAIATNRASRRHRQTSPKRLRPVPTNARRVSG